MYIMYYKKKHFKESHYVVLQCSASASILGSAPGSALALILASSTVSAFFLCED